MFRYYDKLFVRIYYWYIAHKEEDIPALYSILIIGFKQLLKRYPTTESRAVKPHPAIYFCSSLVLLGILRLIGFYPDIG